MIYAVLLIGLATGVPIALAIIAALLVFMGTGEAPIPCVWSPPKCSRE